MSMAITPEKIDRWAKKGKIGNIVKAASSEDAAIREAADKALGEIVQSCSRNLSTLADRKAKVTAARMLGQTKDRRAVRPLISAWYSALGEARVAIVEALGELGDEDGIEKIKDSLYSSAWGHIRDGKLRSASLKALKSISTPQAQTILKTYERRVNQERADARSGRVFRCPYCGRTLSRYSTSCPHCRGILKR
jgi:HEAT repeat protein